MIANSREISQRLKVITRLLTKIDNIKCWKYRRMNQNSPLQFL